MGCGPSSSPTAAQSPVSADLVTGTGPIPSITHVSGEAMSRISINPTRPIARPLTKPAAYKHPTALTMGDLNNRRNEYWASRSEGNVYMWQAIRSAAEALLADDLVLASAILEASNMATPNGSLELCYDELGRPYKTPLYCMTTPTNMISPNSPNKYPQKTTIINSLNSVSQITLTAVPLNLKVRINPGDFNMSIAASTTDSIEDLKHYILEQSSQQQIITAIPICDELRQRVIFMGQELENAQILGDVGVDESKVVQIFLRPLPVIKLT